MILPSKYQAAILDAVMHSTHNLLIQAAAGSGKTSTLEMICNALPTRLRVLAVCFNKSIADTFKRRLPGHVEARTLHSVGLRMMGKVWPTKPEIDNNKVRNIVRDHVEGMSFPDGMEWPDRQDLRGRLLESLPRMVSLAQATMADPLDVESVQAMADEYQIELPDSIADFEYCGHLSDVIAKCREMVYVISFDDMLDFPVFYQNSIPWPRYDMVLVDEAQDLNRQQIEFVSRLVDPAGGRIVAVGDRHQAIYGFRGADHGAMDRIKERFDCKEMPLSVCYRCGSKIIEEAQKIVGAEFIEAAPGAPEGIVKRSPPKESQKTMDSLRPGDMVLCRTNAPLAGPCFRMISQGRRATVMGTDIGKGLTTLIRDTTRKYNAESIPDLLEGLERWKQKKMANLAARERWSSMATVDDQVQTIAALADQVDTIEELEQAVERVFKEQKEGVVFSSIHKAKGLESERVVILRPDLMPHPMAIKSGKESVRRQEDNLRYVAVTRAMRELVFQES